MGYDCQFLGHWDYHGTNEISTYMSQPHVGC